MAGNKLSTIKPKDMSSISEVKALYLDNIRDTLTGAALRTPAVDVFSGPVKNQVSRPYNEKNRWEGNEWCDYCYTMAGGARVQNVRELMESVIEDAIPGDFLEAGAWRGGCSIMARLVQQVMGEGEQRRTLVCDSFSGLPAPSQSADLDFWASSKFLQVSQSEVETNFKHFQALDDNVQFRKGYFSESLPKVREELLQQGKQLAVLRGDGDMYESYMDILYNLYEFVPVGGYFICDDCPKVPESQRAIDDFRKQHNLVEPIQLINGSFTGSFWRKTSPSVVNYTKYLEWNATRVFGKLKL